MFSVAPTLGKSKFIFSPIILSQEQIIFPCFLLILIPNFSKLFKCNSIGLVPISQPPACDSLWVHEF